MSYQILLGDNRQILPTLADNSVDSIVTDPPYELGFMGKTWDSTGIAYDVGLWRECLRVLKPGGHLLAFGGSRTYHRLACAVEDAGFEIRDQIMWVYGSGFPKSLDISKAIDKAAGAERQVIGAKITGKARTAEGWQGGQQPVDITTPATDEAKRWEGWGTALKPAHEPIVVARKPLSGTVAANVLEWGVGGLNIDGCRVGDEVRFNSFAGNKNTGMTAGDDRTDSGKGLFAGNVEGGSEVAGRWPANLIHDGSDEVLELFPDTTSKSGGRSGSNPNPMSWDEQTPTRPRGGHDDSGSAARFFYCAKAGKKERNAGLDGMPERTWKEQGFRNNDSTHLSPRAGAGRTSANANHHPTVKPIALMRYLVRLVTPPNGTVLDPFTGSGTTGIATILENNQFIGIEMTPEYAEIAQARIQHWEQTR